MLEVKLGKINRVIFGSGGYNDAMFGVSFELGGQGWGVADFWGMWTGDPSPHAKWTKEDQLKHRAETMGKIIDLMQKAKVNDLNKLQGIPVEITFEFGTLKSWRVLEEVL